MSIRDQVRQIEEFCRAKGYDLVEVFTDAGLSGTNESRPEFQRLLANTYSSEAPYDFVIVHSISRFARDSVTLETHRRKMLAMGSRLLSITQPVEDSDEGDTMTALYALFDSYSSKQNARHVLRGMNQCARDGHWPGVAPDGYRKVEVGKVGDRIKYDLEPCPVRSKVIEQIFRLALDGDGEGPMGVARICEWLNTRGITTRLGGRWGNSTVHAMLQNTLYKGEHYFNVKSSKQKRTKPREEWIPFSVTPIVDAELLGSTPFVRTVGKGMKLSDLA